MKPLHDNVLVEPRDEDKSAGGVLLPDNAKEAGHYRRGKVIAVGPGKQVWTDSGAQLDPPTVETGQMVWFDTYASGKVYVEGREHFLVPASRIGAVE